MVPARGAAPQGARSVPHRGRRPSRMCRKVVVDGRRVMRGEAVEGVELTVPGG